MIWWFDLNAHPKLIPPEQNIIKKVHKSDQIYNAGQGTNVELEATSIQLAYTMGGASMRLADVKVDNNLWTAGATRDATVVSLGLAF